VLEGTSGVADADADVEVEVEVEVTLEDHVLELVLALVLDVVGSGVQVVVGFQVVVGMGGFHVKMDVGNHSLVVFGGGGGGGGGGGAPLPSLKDH